MARVQNPGEWIYKFPHVPLVPTCGSSVPLGPVGVRGMMGQLVTGSARHRGGDPPPFVAIHATVPAGWGEAVGNSRVEGWYSNEWGPHFVRDFPRIRVKQMQNHLSNHARIELAGREARQGSAVLPGPLHNVRVRAGVGFCGCPPGLGPHVRFANVTACPRSGWVR